MSDRPTPETDAAAWFWYGDCAPEEEMIVPAELAKKLERERDEARESLKHITEYGTEEINAAVELRQKLAQAMMQRDEWAAMCGRYKRERDEAREKAERYEQLKKIPKWYNSREIPAEEETK